MGEREGEGGRGREREGEGRRGGSEGEEGGEWKEEVRRTRMRRRQGLNALRTRPLASCDLWPGLPDYSSAHARKCYDLHFTTNFMG